MVDSNWFQETETSPGYRRSSRSRLTAEVFLRRRSRANYRVPVVDCSISGCRVELVERPAAGERIWVKFEDLERLEATVRWVEGFLAGLEFQRPLHPAVFEMLMRRFKGRPLAPRAGEEEQGPNFDRRTAR